MNKVISFVIFLLLVSRTVMGQEIKAQVLSTEGEKLHNATIAFIELYSKTSTDKEGYFSLPETEMPLTLIISFVGYASKEIQLVKPYPRNLTIELEVANDQVLEEVKVFTGYEMLPKERATGSFFKLDKELLNRAPANNILDRLVDVVPGLTFTDVGTLGSEQSTIIIRGQSTIKSNKEPLIVLDNFPYSGNLGNINPNDVESITVLKDAAASSIWGARAGNGVIVITTKTGAFNTKPRVSFNSSVTVGEKPDLFRAKRILTPDFIDIEKDLFKKGVYGQYENSSRHEAMTPVVELLIQKRDHPELAAEIDSQIEALKLRDFREDLTNYYYRKSKAQQYALSIKGGNQHQNYIVSGGVDRNLASLKANSYDRITLHADHTYAFLNHKLDLFTVINYTQGTRDAYQMDSYLSMGNIYPYASLRDEKGKPTAIAKDYRPAFTDSALENGLLNWDYKPLDEMNLANNIVKTTDYNLNVAVKYNVLPRLSTNVLYQYNRNLSNQRNLQSVDSYFTRDLVNSYTSINSDGSLNRPIPLGGILGIQYSNRSSQNLRGQVNYNAEWQGKHNVYAIAGMEVSDASYLSNNSRLYGYDEQYATQQPVDYVGNCRSIVDGYNYRISNQDKEKQLFDRFLSYYFNGSYDYLNRYTASFSGRLDQSNLFGVKTNQKGVPLYSVGLSWNIHKEGFYDSDYFSLLKLRFTYGISGNVNKGLSAYTTAQYLRGVDLFYAKVLNPSNPQLRWEKLKTTNVAIDFATKNSRLTGTIEYYNKVGIDLIGVNPMAPQTGISEFTGNSANTRGRGWDIVLNSLNVHKFLQWNTVLLFNYNEDKVTKYLAAPARTADYVEGPGLPVEGRSLYAIYSYPWAGLDPNNGNAQGYVDGEISDNYQEILSTVTPENLIYHGSARPTVYGALRNNFSYKGFSASVNISYRFGYWFRRESIDYGTLEEGKGGHSDYYRRWLQKGDENNTDVPSQPVVIEGNQTRFYDKSEALVEKGDHFRLNDLRLSYDFKKMTKLKLPLNSLEVFIYANNLGILWKANQADLDPDYYLNAGFPPIRTISFGLRVDL